jgi:hypothetical protein
MSFMSVYVMSAGPVPDDVLPPRSALRSASSPLGKDRFRERTIDDEGMSSQTPIAPNHCIVEDTSFVDETFTPPFGMTLYSPPFFREPAPRASGARE